MENTRRLLRHILLFLSPAIVVTITYILTKDLVLGMNNDNRLLILASIIGGVGLITGFVVTRFYYGRLNQINEFAYNIAILGLPGSGKTTLITSLFGAVIYRKISLRNYDTMLKGNATIDRINENLALLEKGYPIGSTTDQTLFSYRLNLTEKHSSFLQPRKEYNVEIGDFQGEMTSVLTEQEITTWKHNSDFFSWVKDAHSFIFVVDLGPYLLSPTSYTIEISTTIRSAWQKILNMNSSQVEKIREKPLILIFNKADLLLYDGLTKLDLEERAFSSNWNETPKVSKAKIRATRKDSVIKDFINLIEFLEFESKNFTYEFFSSFIEDEYEYRAGVHEIAHHSFPGKY